MKVIIQNGKEQFFTVFYAVRRGRQVALWVAETSRILHFWIFFWYLAHAWKIDQKVFQGPKFDARAGFFGHRLIKWGALREPCLCVLLRLLHLLLLLMHLGAAWISFQPFLVPLLGRPGRFLGIF